MLTSSQLQNADKYVQFFYQQLALTPINYNGKSLVEVARIFPPGLDITFYKHRIFEPGIDYQEEIQKLNSREQEIFTGLQEDAAQEAGVHLLGMKKLLKRVPIILYSIELEGKSLLPYYALARNLPDKSLLEQREYQIGINPSILQTHCWSHVEEHGIPSLSGGSFKNAERFTSLSIITHVQENIDQKVQALFNGILYFGLSTLAQEKILLCVDMPGEARVFQSSPGVVKRCEEVCERYSLDGIFSLYATTGKCPGFSKLSDQVRLDPSDTHYTDLQISNLDDIRRKLQIQLERETLWRQFLMSPLGAKKWEESNLWPEQIARNMMRDFMELQMDLWKNEVVKDGEIK